MHGSPRVPFVVRRALALAALLGTAVGGLEAAASPVIVRMAGRGGTAPLSEALAGKLPSARVVELTGDLPADAARISRETRGIPVLFAIGPVATEAAGEARGPAVVSLGVANPAQLKTPGTYVSIYPNLDRVFEYVKTSLKAARVGLVFSPAKNREIGLQFLKAGSAQGVMVLPITVASSGDLVRELKGALPKVDAVLLAVDPLLFEDERNLEFILEQSVAARKPTVGFLEDLANLGVTVALVAPAEEVAATAVAASAQPVLVGKKRVEVDGISVIVSRKAAAAIGLDGEALSARKLE
jgi:ABC-type uncharacterized transport system substrate-binding protein